MLMKDNLEDYLKLYDKFSDGNLLKFIMVIKK